MGINRKVAIILLTGLAFWHSGLPAHGPDTGLVGPADGMIVTRHFTGIWDQVNQESQGIALQVVEQVSGARRAVAYWYTYGADRQSAWFIGIGDLVDNRIEMELFESVDVGFLQDAEPGNDSVSRIGIMSIVFDSCQSGEVRFDTSHPEVGSGAFRIERLLEVMNTHCSGGISDDMHADGRFGLQRLELLPVRAGLDASGQARYEDQPGHMELEIEVEGLPDGTYRLQIGSREISEFAVAGGRAELMFSSPAEDGHRLLNFDPRGVALEIHDGQGAVLSSYDERFEEHEHDPYGGGTDHDDDEDHPYDCGFMGPGHGMGMGGRHECVDQGDSVAIEIDLENTGVAPGAAGEAEWEMNAYRIRFSVDLEGVPVGSYPLRVGGMQVGVVEAHEMHDGAVYGRIGFRDPEAFGARPLDFDPRGQSIELMQGETVILEARFPDN